MADNSWLKTDKFLTCLLVWLAVNIKVVFRVIGSFRNDDGDGNENVKKRNGFVTKQQLCTFLCRYCTTTTWKCLISRFIEDVRKRRRIFLSLSKLECGPQETTLRIFAYIGHFQWIGINATTFEKTQIPFQSDVLSAVVVVDAKAPYLIDQSVRSLTNHDDEFRLATFSLSSSSSSLFHHPCTASFTHKPCGTQDLS